MAQMELAVLDFIQEFFRNPFMDSLMPAVTSLGDAGFLWSFWDWLFYAAGNTGGPGRQYCCPWRRIW